MKQHRIIRFSGLFLLLGVLFGLASCNDWTEMETVDNNVKKPWEQDPALWAEYTAALRDYKKERAFHRLRPPAQLARTGGQREGLHALPARFARYRGADQCRQFLALRCRGYGRHARERHESALAGGLCRTCRRIRRRRETGRMARPGRVVRRRQRHGRLFVTGIPTPAIRQRCRPQR